MTATRKENTRIFPKSLRLKLIEQSHKGNIDAKKKTIENYSSPVKLKSVIRWRERMARGGIDTKTLADAIGVKTTRMSEWLNFTHEPREDKFNAVEAALYEMGV